MEELWHAWLDADWACLGGVRKVWELFVANPYKLQVQGQGTASKALTKCDAILQELFIRAKEGPRSPIAAMYIIALIVHDSVAGVDFVSGLDNAEAQDFLDGLVDLQADVDPAVRFWAIKTLWRALEIYRDCVNNKPPILAVPRWKAASKASWLEDKYFSVKRGFSRGGFSEDMEVFSDDAFDDNTSGFTATAASSEKQDTTMAGLHVAHANLLMWSLLAVTGKSRKQAKKYDKLLSMSDVRVIWEVLMDEVEAPTIEAMHEKKLDVLKSEIEIEAFGKSISNEHMLAPLFLILTLVDGKFDERSKYLQNLNLLIIKNEANVRTFISTERWQSFAILMLCCYDQDATKKEAATFGQSKDPPPSFGAYALNLLICTSSCCFEQYRRLDEYLFKLLIQFVHLCAWDTKAHSIVTFILKGLLKQLQSTNFWRTSESDNLWASCFQLVKVILTFVFFLPLSGEAVDGFLIPGCVESELFHVHTENVSTWAKAVLRIDDNEPEVPLKRSPSEENAYSSFASVSSGEPEEKAAVPIDHPAPGAQKLLQARRSSGMSGKPSGSADNCVELAALAISHQVLVQPRDRVKGALTLNIGKHDPSRVLHASKVENLGLHFDDSGTALDLELVDCLCDLFNAMGCKGDERDAKTLADMFFEKKDRNFFLKASEICRGCRSVQRLLRLGSKTPLNEQGNAKISNNAISQLPPALVGTSNGLEFVSVACEGFEDYSEEVREVAAFLVGFCAKGNYLTKKSLSRALASKLKTAMVSEDACVSSEHTNKSLETPSTRHGKQSTSTKASLVGRLMRKRSVLHK